MKKLLSILLALSLWTLPLSAQVIVVKHKAGGGPPVTSVQVHSCVNGGSQTLNCSTASNVTAGNNIVLAIAWRNEVAYTATLASITSTSCQSNGFTVQAASLATIAGGTHYQNLNTGFATAPVTASGSCTITVNLSASPGGGPAGINVEIRELTAGTYSLGGVGTNANTNVPTCGSFTPSTNGSYAIAIGVLDNGFGFGSGWFTAGSPFTLSSQFGGGNFDGSTEAYAQTTAASLAGTFGSNYPTYTGPNACSAIYYHE